VAAYTGPDPCKHALKGSGQIVKACLEGGLKKAKAVMKAMTKAGRAAGQTFDCDDCHKDDTDYSQLTSDAHEKLDKLAAAIGQKH
jgi:hypothetical protein